MISKKHEKLSKQLLDGQITSSELKAQDKYDLAILALMKKHGYMLGMELNGYLTTKFSITVTNARKIVQRAVEHKVIRSSYPVTFGKGQFAYYIGQMDYETILLITSKYRPPLNRVLSILKVNKVLSFYEALKISGAMLEGGKGKNDTLQKLVEEMEELGLVVQKTEDGVRYLLLPNTDSSDEQLMSKHLSHMKLDATLIPDIIRSLRKYNIIDNDKILYRNKQTPSIGVRQNDYVWDVVGYTNAVGYNSGTAPGIEKQTMALIDVMAHRTYTSADFNGFMARVRAVINSVKTGKRKVLPIIVYRSLESELLRNQIAKAGFLMFDLHTAYGSNVDTIIDSMAIVKQGAVNEDNMNVKVAAIDKTLKTVRTSGQEDNLGNLKGDLFEMLLYPLIAGLFPGCSITQGKSLPKANGESGFFEFDYLIQRGLDEELVVIECKGHREKNIIKLGDSSTKNSVKWFFDYSLLAAKQWAERRNASVKITPCYITSSGFEQAATNYMDKLHNGKFGSTDIDIWYDRKKLQAILDAKKLKKVKEILKKYYS